MQGINEQEVSLERSLTVSVSGDEIQAAVQKELMKLQKETKQPGFRKGKVPFEWIDKKYRLQVTERVLNQLSQAAVEKQLQLHRLQPIQPVQLKLKEPYQADQEVLFEANFEVYPEFELASLDGIEIEAPVCEITPQDIDHMLERLRYQARHWENVNRPAQLGDRVTIDLMGKFEEEHLEDACAKDLVFILGESAPFPQIDAILINGVVESKYEFDYTYPKEAMIPESLRGKTVRFQALLKNIEEGRLPALDEAFAARFLDDAASAPSGALLQTLRESLRTHMLRQARRLTHKIVADRVTQKLYERHQIPLPKSLIASEIQVLRAQAREQLVQAGVPEEDANTWIESLPNDHFEGDARRRSSIFLLLSKALTTYQVPFSRLDVEKLIEEEALNYDQPQKFFALVTKNKAAMERFRNAAIERQVIGALLEQITVKRRSVSFTELFGSHEASFTGPLSVPNPVEVASVENRKESNTEEVRAG